MKVKLVLEYSGATFSGWQMQEGVPTVQGELERAITVYVNSLAKRGGIPQLERIAVTGSGRTDAGVHARGQVASFSWPAELPFDNRTLLAALNGISVPELVILSAEGVDDSFDARHTPHLKCYCYSFLLRDQFDGLYTGRSWGVGENLSLPNMIEAARYLVGQHDFTSFRARDCTAQTAVRTVLGSELTRVSRYELAYRIYGRGFLKQMVRIIAGTLVEIGRRKHPASYMLEVLNAKDRTRAGETGPAEGLTMEWVRYDI